MQDNLIVELFQSLGLQDLDNDWVGAMHSSEFTEEPEIEINLSSSLARDLHELNDALRDYSKTLFTSLPSGQVRCCLLNDLKQAGVTSEMIQCWIYYICYKGLQASSEFEQKHLCILAADTYFLLLKLPGMSSSEFHHSIIFEKAIDSLLMVAQIQSGDVDAALLRKRKATWTASQSQKRKKRYIQDAGHEEDGQNNDDNAVVISPHEAATLFKKLEFTLRDFCKYLTTVSLRSNEVALRHSIQTLAKIAICLQTNCPVSLVDFSLFSLDGSATASLTLPYQLVIYGLFLTVSVKHGELDQLCLMLFRFILQILIMKNATSPSVPRAFYQNAEIFSRLVCHLFDVHGDAVIHSISVLAQNLLAQCPDRVEFRNHCSTTLVCILNRMPLQCYANFCDWLRRIALHTKITYRSNALAVATKLLCQPERGAQEETNDDPPASVKHGYLLNIVASRLMDAAPSVRSKSLSALVEIMEGGFVSTSALGSVANAKGKDYEVETPQVVSTTRRTTMPSTLRSIPVSAIESGGTVTKSTSSLLQLLINCSLEPKAMVRKAAVQALGTAIKYKFVLLDAEGMDALSTRCRDPSLMVRKLAISSISDVLAHHQKSSEAMLAWAKGVLPTILDAENSVQEKALKLVDELILANIDVHGVKSELAWKLMGVLASPECDGIKTYLMRAIKQWHRQSNFGSQLIKKIVEQLEIPERSAASWLFLQLLTLYKCDKNAAVKITEVWLQQYKKENTLIFNINSVVTIGHVCKHLPQEMKKQTLDVCVARLKAVHCPLQLISYLVEAICNIIEAIHKDDPASEEWPLPLMRWGEMMLKNVDECLYKFVIATKNDDCNLNDHLLIHQLYIAGNVGKYCIKRVPKRLILSIQALLTSTECLNSTTQAQLSQDIPPSQPLSQFAQSGGVPQHIRAHAVINLGKLCNHNSNLAKKCIAAMVRELDLCSNESVRLNVLIVLADLFVQETHIVDSYISDMSNCLGDESFSIRKNALVLISSLLKKDYIKWRGSLIYKFLTLLCDKSDEVRDLVRYSLLSQTLQRNAGDMFFRHFIESIFYFNAYSKHKAYNRFSKSNRELKLFDFSGTENENNRMIIYTFMLNHMDDEHRIKLMGKLCSDILDAVVDGSLPLNEQANPILGDALSLICSPEIKLRCMKPTEDDLEVEDVQEAAALAARNAVKQKIMSQVVKRNLLENIIPIIVAVKNTLVTHKSPMVKNVMLCLKEIMKDYKTEVQDVLAADKQLAAEIEFDLKRFDREEEEQLRREQAAQQVRPNYPRVSGTDSPELILGTGSASVVQSPGLSTPRRGQVITIRRPSSAGGCGSPVVACLEKENEQVLGATGILLTSAAALRRQRGLGIKAMIESAKKHMMGMKINGDSQGDRGIRTTRAISTPAKNSALSDLTFSNVAEISSIPTPSGSHQQ